MSAIPEGKYVDVGDGLRLHYHEAGPPAGPSVLFLHGSGPGASGWSNFRRNYPVIAERGFRTLVPDTLGFGLSSQPEHLDYGMDLLVPALGRALDALGVRRCAVIGNSHGGALAIKLALEQPERVSRLVLMAPGGLEQRETYMQMAGIRAMVKAVLGAKEPITRVALREVLALQLHDPALLSEDIVDERFPIALTQPRRVMSSLAVPYLAPELGRLSCPIFGLWGMNDQFCPVSGAMTLARTPRSRVLLVAECGHWVMVEHAALFNRLVIDFLGES